MAGCRRDLPVLQLPTGNQFDGLGPKKVVRDDARFGVFGNAQSFFFDQEDHVKIPAAFCRKVDGRDLSNLKTIDHNGVGYRQPINVFIDGMKGIASSPRIEPFEVVDTQNQQRPPNEDEHADFDFPAFLHVPCLCSVPLLFDGLFQGDPRSFLKSHDKSIGKTFQPQGIAHLASGRV